MQRYFDVVRLATGEAVSNAEVRVYLGDSNDLATVHDGAESVVGQPLATDDSGAIVNGAAGLDGLGFKAVGGRYRVNVQKTGLDPFDLPDVLLGESQGFDVPDLQALVTEGVYPTVQDGLDSTTSGNFFWVVDDSSNPSSHEFVLYEDVDDAAVERTRLPSLRLSREIRDATLQAGSVFDTIAEGLAATSDGEFFVVPDATRLVLYRNDAGSETEILRFAGPVGSLAAEVPTNALLGAYLPVASGTNTYSANLDRDVGDLEVVSAYLGNANTGATPTLENANGLPTGAKTVTTKGGAVLWAGALSGRHQFQRDATADTWLVLDPNPKAGDEPASTTFARAVGVPVGGNISVQDDVPGAQAPDNSGDVKWVKLTAGEDGAGQYNEGLLTSESVSGSSPSITATAVISHAASPMDGQTIRLINTEERFLRAGNAGVVQDDAFQGHKHTASEGLITNVNAGQFAGGSSRKVNSLENIMNGYAEHSPYGTPRVDVETRPRNVGTTYYMRIA